MGGLVRFASSRKETDSDGSHCVVIISLEGKFPSADSMWELRNEVPMVETRRGAG